MPRPSTDSDPLARAMAPPKDETPEQRAVREQQEAEARRVSDMIDEQIKAEASAMRKRHKKPPIKVLLLGQSESGASCISHPQLRTHLIYHCLNLWNMACEGKSTTVKSEPRCPSSCCE